MEHTQTASLDVDPRFPQTEDFPLGCEPFVEDMERRQLLFLMAEYFRTVGCSEAKARLAGFPPPPVLSGTLQDHRPDFTCRQGDSARTPLLLEVVTVAVLADPERENRWSLLSSAANLYGAELHFVVPKWTEHGALEPLLRRRLSNVGIVPAHVWNV